MSISQGAGRSNQGAGIKKEGEGILGAWEKQMSIAQNFLKVLLEILTCLLGGLSLHPFHPSLKIKTDRPAINFQPRWNTLVYWDEQDILPVSFLIIAKEIKLINDFIVSYPVERIQGYPRYFFFFFFFGIYILSGWEGAAIISALGNCHRLSPLNPSCHAQDWVTQE